MKIALSRAPDAERVVSPLELFFDLVYVFAIGQLSHHLLVAVRPNGQQRLYVVRPEGLDALRDFLAKFWPAQLQQLKQVVEADIHDR